MANEGRRRFMVVAGGLSMKYNVSDTVSTDFQVYESINSSYFSGIRHYTGSNLDYSTTSYSSVKNIVDYINTSMLYMITIRKLEYKGGTRYSVNNLYLLEIITDTLSGNFIGEDEYESDYSAASYTYIASNYLRNLPVLMEGTYTTGYTDWTNSYRITTFPYYTLSLST